MLKQAKNNRPISTATTQAQDIIIAKPIVRLVAMLYDGMLILSMLFLVSLALAVVGTLAFGEVGKTAADAQSLPVWYQNGVMSPAFVLTLIGFYGVFWRKSGQTLGMQTWQLKTVTATGELLGWSQSVRRIICACLLPLLCAMIGALVYHARLAVIASAFLGLLGNYIFGMFHAKGLAFHDILSNTMTLKIPKFEHEGLFASFKRSKK
ncbi:RDD family protein [Moraxella nasovis]|uniref:RDD family protein n=1 Tax=Moraxella nasovis TaxID=2904121 RepID=UPI001F6161F3|nr:RDD family protein [Moraxella nasovis]UNU73928.1 RDD family protein [Moraxella nasovis]